MDTNEQHEPPSADELPRQIVIAIIGETVLESVHQIAQSIQEKIVRLLADESSSLTQPQNSSPEQSYAQQEASEGR
jgi:hypothetical protein